MSHIQSKITKHEKRQKNIISPEQNNQPIEIDSEPIQISEWQTKTLKQLF